MSCCSLQNQCFIGLSLSLNTAKHLWNLNCLVLFTVQLWFKCSSDNLMDNHFRYFFPVLMRIRSNMLMTKVIHAKKVYQVFIIIVHATLPRISSLGGEANDNVQVFSSVSHISWLLPSLDILFEDLLNMLGACNSLPFLLSCQ